MNTETYINHPTFGLLYRLCLLKDHREIYTTLYAQRLFFMVIMKGERINFEPIARSDARLLVDTRLRELRRDGAIAEYKEVQYLYQKTF